jgi:hypothetical protein
MGDPSAIQGMSDLMRAEGQRAEAERRSYPDLLTELINSGRFPAIGGQAQQMIADRSGATVLPSLVPSDRGSDQADLMLLNMPADQLGGVGDCTLFTRVIGPWPRA